MPLLPKESPRAKRGRPRVSRHHALCGVVCLLLIGSPWRFLPKKRGGGSGGDVLARAARLAAGRRPRLLTRLTLHRLALATSPEWFREVRRSRPVPSLSRRSPLYLVISLKFIVPSLMLRCPLVGAWGNYILDSIDGDILLELGLSEDTYQTIDKAADYFSYIVMLIVGLRWRIKRLIVLLFVYRTIGQGLFFVTRNEMAFVFFPNFLEPLVLAYTFLLFRNKGSEELAYASYRKHLGLIWIIISGYKVWNEWYLHYANIDLSSRFFGFTGGAQESVQTPSPS